MSSSSTIKLRYIRDDLIHRKISSFMDQPETGSKTPSRGISDRESVADSLNFTPYVRALQRFLLETSPPLTVSIEGEWGAGKTSFMSQLRKRLKDDGYVTIYFNPWRHRTDESVWAAFILTFIDQLSDRLTDRERRYAQWRLLRERSEEHRKKILLQAGVGLVLYLVIVGAIFSFGTPVLDILGALGVTAFSGIGLFIWIQENLIKRTENKI